MFTRKSKSLAIYELEEQTPSPERTRKLSTESNSGVFTITESFEYDNDLGMFYESPIKEFPESDADSEAVRRRRCQEKGRYLKNGPEHHDSLSTLWNFKANYQEFKCRILTIRNAFRLVAYILCLFYCFRYAYSILSQYAHFETIVTLEYRSPQKTLVPAISICSHCILCTIPERRFMLLAVHQIFAEDNTWHWVKNTPGENGEKAVDISVDCQITSMFRDQQIKCSDVVKPLVSIQEGHKCVTFFSNMNAQMMRLNRTAIDPLIFDYNFVPRVVFNISGTFLKGYPTNTTFQNNSELNMNDPKRSTFRRTGVYIKLHERNLLPDMKDLNYHKVRPGVKTTIAFTKKTVRLLPKPYKTGCYNYSKNQNTSSSPWQSDRETVTGTGKLETPSGLRYYRTRGECILYCLWRHLNTGRCVNFFSLVTRDIQNAELASRRSKWVLKDFEKGDGDPEMDTADFLTFNHSNSSAWGLRYCSNSEDQYVDYVNAKNLCVTFCPEDCFVEYFYEDNIQEMENDNRFRRSWKNQTQVQVEWAVGPVTNVYHNERMDFNEFFGTLGGHFHIWIGLSVPFVLRILIGILKKLKPFTKKCIQRLLNCF